MLFLVCHKRRSKMTTKPVEKKGTQVWKPENKCQIGALDNIGKHREIIGQDTKVEKTPNTHPHHTPHSTHHPHTPPPHATADHLPLPLPETIPPPPTLSPLSSVIPLSSPLVLSYRHSFRSLSSFVSLVPLLSCYQSVSHVSPFFWLPLRFPFSSSYFNLCLSLFSQST